MCRLMISSVKDFMDYDTMHGVIHLWSHLEKECGGQGNGVVVVDRKGKILYHDKGVEAKLWQLYQGVLATKAPDDATVIFHTRVASIGKVGDANCHPYADKKHTLAMNGTEYGLSDVADTFGITDTEVMFKLLAGKDLEDTLDVLSLMSAVYIGTVGGEPFAVTNTGDLCLWKHGDNSMHASSFPRQVTDTVRTDEGYEWIGGESNGVFWEPKVSSKNSILSKWGGNWYDWDYQTQMDPLGRRRRKSNDDDGDGFNPDCVQDDWASAEDAYYQGYDEGYADGCANG